MDLTGFDMDLTGFETTTAHKVALKICFHIDYFILKYTGRAMTSTEIYDSLQKIIQNKASKREVLMHGA